MNTHESPSAVPLKDITTEVYSSDHPENYGYTEEQRARATDPNLARQEELEKMALNVLGEVPEVPGLSRGKVLSSLNKNLAKSKMSPTELHRYEQSLRNGKPWDDKYKDHPREKISNLMEDPAGNGSYMNEDELDTVEVEEGKSMAA